MRLKGEDITFATPAKRGIGMVFQNYALFPHLTVERNVAFPLEMRNVAKAQIRERVAAVLQLVGLGELAARLPRELSGGQQQRVALARSVVFDPGLLLLDEPFGALDRKLREQMQLEVKRLQRRLGLTALFVTHDQEEALVLSDRIAVMSAGRIEQLGTPEEIYAHPVNWFVADFVGESNLFRGRLGADGAGKPLALMDGGARIAVPPSPFAPGSEVGVLVRPERPRLLADGAVGRQRRARAHRRGDLRRRIGQVSAAHRRHARAPRALAVSRAGRHARRRRRHHRRLERERRASRRRDAMASALPRRVAGCAGASTPGRCCSRRCRSRSCCCSSWFRSPG